MILPLFTLSGDPPLSQSSGSSLVPVPFSQVGPGTDCLCMRGFKMSQEKLAHVRQLPILTKSLRNLISINEQRIGFRASLECEMTT